MKTRTCKLKTPFEDALAQGWERYPRPQMRRASYLSLCGEWDLSCLEQGTEKILGKICVPFPPESRLSGVMAEPKPCTYFYTKHFTIPNDF